MCHYAVSISMIYTKKKGKKYKAQKIVKIITINLVFNKVKLTYCRHTEHNTVDVGKVHQTAQTTTHKVNNFGGCSKTTENPCIYLVVIHYTT